MLQRHFWGSVDGLTEAALAKVKMDGMDLREIAAVIHQLGWEIRPLPKGQTKGRIQPEERRVYLCLFGSERQVRATMSHEGGHIILHTQGYRLPHCECCADRIGRSIVFGRCLIRKLLLGGLDVDVHGFVERYSDFFPPDEIALRIEEVRRTMWLRVG